MGLFDGFKNSNSQISEYEAYIAIIVAAMGVDGDIADEEIESLVTNLRRLPSYSNNFDIVQNVFNKCMKIIRSSGASGLLDIAIPKLKNELRQTAFAQAVDMVIADGEVNALEEEFIEKLKNGLNIEDSMAEHCVEIVSIKNKIF